MDTFLKRLDKVISVILSCFVAFIALGVIATVVMRYFFGLSFGAFEEFLTMAFVMMVFLGSALCIREKQHISISFFADKLSPKRKLISDIVIMAGIIIVNLVVLVYSIKWIMAVGSSVSPASGVMKGVYYTIVPISAALTIFYCVIDILGHFIPIAPSDAGYFNDDELSEEAK
jgi:TRAP-type C4-dicarboxylate transport system permease small subunit